MECDIITLENGINYVVLKELEYNNSKYVFLSNENNNKDFCIRKKVIKNNEEFLMGLDSNEEFDEVLKEFAKNE